MVSLLLRVRHLDKNEYSKEWFKRNPEYRKQWKEKHKEHIIEYNKKYYIKNRELILKKNKEWWVKNLGYDKIYRKEYRKTEIGKAIDQRKHYIRRTREKNILNTLTAQEWLDILEQHNNRCAYCGVEFNCELSPEREHVIPISKGGNNTKENIVPACRNCNAKKHNKIL